MTKGLLKLSGALTITALCLSACDKPAATTTDATAEPAKESTPTISANDKPAEQGAAQTPPADKKQEEAVTVATVGKPAPDFTLKDQEGKEHKLSALKGKVVVLEWTNPNCPYVVRHYKADTMIKAHKELGPDEIAWMAIDSSQSVTPEESKKWREAEGFDYPVLQDAEGAAGKLYGAKTTPHMFVIDKEGVLRYAGAIDDNAREDVEAPRNYVIEAVKSLKEGKALEVSETKPYGCSVKYKS
jgi:peroxiredoxin